MFPVLISRGKRVLFGMNLSVAVLQASNSNYEFPYIYVADLNTHIRDRSCLKLYKKNYCIVGLTTV